MAIPRVDSIDVSGKNVILRAVLNVPIQNGNITDEFRLDAVVPTIKYLLEKNAKVTIVGFVGRPKGQRIAEMSLAPVATALAAKLNTHVELIDDFLQADQKAKIVNGQAGQVFLLENIRFYAQEESEDAGVRSEFAKQLAELGEVYVNDAFADYRAQVSTFDLPKIMSSKAVGFNYAEEVAALDKVMANPERPFVAVIGGAKLSEKIDILNTLGEKADKILIGGAMAYTFLKFQGHTIGNSLVEADKVAVAGEILAKYGDKIELPVDHIVANSFNENEEPQVVNGKDIPDNVMALDIGTETRTRYLSVIDSAKTILWNGPMGVFEWEKYNAGTREVGSKIADQGAYTLVGGGDTISAVNSFSLEYGVNHICTGGGAMLEYLAKGTLETIEALK
jgi:phosphoglycerate kinase